MCVCVCVQVWVKGLPRRTTAQEIHDHFNKLYDLSKPDWTFPVRYRAAIPHRFVQPL